MFEPRFIPWDEIQVGDEAQRSSVISDESVMAFSAVIGDVNSFHVSDQAAAATVFKKRIVHGIHLASFISVLVGQELPGFGTIYLTQTLDFKKPVYIGETVTMTVRVLEKLPRRCLRMSTVMTDSGGKVIFDGEAVVKTYK